MLYSRWIFFITLLCLSVIDVLASSNSLYQYNNSVSLAIVAQTMHYEELSIAQGRETIDDKNHGTIPGLSLSLRHQFGLLYTEFGLSAARGFTPYNGSTQVRKIPISNKQAPSFIFDGYGAFGIILESSPRFALIPYILLGYHSWDRTNRSGTINEGDTERYQNSYYAGGMRLEFLLGRSFIMSLYGAYGRTFNQTTNSPLTALSGDPGIPVGGTFLITPKPWYNAGLNLDVAMLQRLHFFATVVYNGFGYGASSRINTRPDVPGSGSDEPTSRTDYWTAALGIAYDEVPADPLIKLSQVTNSILQTYNLATLGFLVDYRKYTLDRAFRTIDSGGVRFNIGIHSGSHEGTPLGGTIIVAKTFGHLATRVLGEFTGAQVKFTSTQVNASTNNANIYHFLTEGSLGYLGFLNERFAITPYVPLGYEHDTYMIRKAALNFPETNTYKFFYTGFGLTFSWQVSNHIIIAPTFAGGLTFDNQVYVPISQVLFSLTSSTWYQMGLLADLAITRKLHLTTSLDYKFINFKQSPLSVARGRSDTSAILPHADTHSIRFMLGLSYQLVS